jgi:hypothetical protein
MKSDCGDIRITDSDGRTLLNAWIESGVNTSSTYIWVKVPSIPASSTKTIYIYYGNPSATLSASGPTGEAPQLSPTYAQYDNGASVFNNYWNFAGTSLPSGWSATSGFTGSVNNGITLTSNSDWQGIMYTASPTSYSNVVIDAYAKEVSRQAFLIGFSKSGDTGIVQNAYAFILDGYANGTTVINRYISSSYTELTSATFVPASNTYYVVSFYFASPNLKGTINYNLLTIQTTDTTYSSLQYLTLGVCTTIGRWVAQWYRVRAYASPEPTTSVGAEEAWRSWLLV